MLPKQMSLVFDPSSNIGNLTLTFENKDERKVISKKESLLVPSWKRVPYHYLAIHRTFQTKKKSKVRTQPNYPRPDHFWCILHYQWCISKQNKLNKQNKYIIITPHYFAYQKTYGSNIGTQLSVFSPKINALWKICYLNYKKRIFEYGDKYVREVPVIYQSNSILFNCEDKIDSNYITIQRVDYEKDGETLRLCY